MTTCTLDRQVQRMVYEQVLTIIFALCVGAAIIVYATKPRQRSVTSSIAPVAVQSFQPAPVAQVTIEAPEVVSTAVPVEVLSVPEVAPAAPEVTALVPIETAATTVESIDAAPAIAKSPARTRRKSTTTRSRAKSGSRSRKTKA